MDPKVLEAIKRVILGETEKLGVRVELIILFGSRAWGEVREGSDYDILVVTREKLGRRDRAELASSVAAMIARVYLVPVDVIVRSREEWREYSRMAGTIEEVAASEGVLVL